MDGVVDRRSNTSIDGVPDHRDIRQQKKQNEQNPTAVIVLIDEESGDEDCGTFDME
jgi:hypothetical protein